MAFYKQDIVDVNLETGVIHRSFLNHTIGHKDDDADRFGIRAFRNGEPVDLSGAQCQAVFMAPDGTNIALTSYGTVSGNEAYVTLPQACYNVEGQFCLAIKLVGGGVTATVRIIDGVVDRTGATGAVAPTEAVPTYQEILAVYAQMQEDIADYESVVANQNDQINSLKSALNESVFPVTGQNDLLSFTGTGGITTNIYLTGGETYILKNTTPNGETVATGALFIAGYDQEYQKTYPSTIGDTIVFSPIHSGYLRMYCGVSGNRKAGISIIGLFDDATKQIETHQNELNNSVFPITGQEEVLSFSGVGGKTSEIYLEGGKSYTIKNITPDGASVATGKIFIVGYDEEYYVTYPSVRGDSISFNPIHSGMLRMYCGISGTNYAGIRVLGIIDTHHSDIASLKNRVTTNEGNITTLQNVTRQSGIEITNVGALAALKYTKPSTGIPETDMAPGVIPDVSGLYRKPATGIPASDIAPGVIPVCHDVPSGGSTGYVLKKLSGADYDIGWQSVAEPTDAQVSDAVNEWLENHPDATTTVQDESITKQKLSASLKLETIKDYVTPQMYGATADGETDDSAAFITALQNANVVMIPSGTYKICNQIEVTNKHRLLAVGTVRIYTSVENDYAFYIHGNEDDDYEQTNYYYDNSKGIWFGGTDGGITLINDGGRNGILFGTVNDPSDTIIGENAIAKIANIGIWGYDIGLKITDYNNYLSQFERLHFERCGDCVVFGDTNMTHKNSGEMLKFIDCIFATSNVAVRHLSVGWESSYWGCSIDFCIIGFVDYGYAKVFFNNGHIEGVGKKNNELLYGIVVDQKDTSIYVFSNTTFTFDALSKGLDMFKGVGTTVIDSSYVSTTIKYPEIEGNPFLSDHAITLTGTLVGQAKWRQFLSVENNLIPDSVLATASLGTLTSDIVTQFVKLTWKQGCTAEIVTGTLLAYHKAIRLNGTGSAPFNAIVKAELPALPNKTYNVGFATYKHSDAVMNRSLRAWFYDKNGVQISETNSYLYEPDKSPKDEKWFPLIGRLFTTPAGTASMEIGYVVSISPDSAALGNDEYIDILYMYCEEY